MSLYGAEFGFRTVKEIARFTHFHRKLTVGNWDFNDAMDAQISQKLLPKLRGSRRKLEPILCALAVICHREHVWTEDERKLVNREVLFDEARRAGTLEDEKLHPLLNPSGFPMVANRSVIHTGGSKLPQYPISFAKIRRMLERVTIEGFASFAEA